MILVTVGVVRSIRSVTTLTNYHMKERESAILAPIPEAESLVQELRNEFDPSAMHGIPAHVTILFPFKHPDEITKKVLKKLRSALSPVQQFDFQLSRIDTFPSVVYLEPTKREKFISITEKVVEVFPENPPYAGRFPNINPHLTIGHELGNRFEECRRQAEDIRTKLPFNARAGEIYLMTSLDGEWTVREHFKLY